MELCRVTKQGPDEEGGHGGGEGDRLHHARTVPHSLPTFLQLVVVFLQSETGVEC